MESLGSTDSMSSVNEETPDRDATGGAAASVQYVAIAEAWIAEDIELYETPGNSKITDRDGKGRWRRALFLNSTK